MKLTPYLNYGGNCAEAFRFYEQHLGGKIVMMMTHDQNPSPHGNLPPELAKGVLHARIDIGGNELMGADVAGWQPMRSAYLTLSVDSDEEADRLFRLLADRGETFMPMQSTFFASRFAMLRDRFGTSWMIVHMMPMPQGGPAGQRGAEARH